MVTLADRLDAMTRPGELYTRLEDGTVQCYACAHRCRIKPGRRGICQVRFNRDGVLYVPWGYVAALQVDPIEKKPFAHVLPGSEALTFGMLGCDFHCSFCQNWLTSQTLRDPAAGIPVESLLEITPEEMVNLARRSGAAAIVSSYNEPLITSEWAVAIFKQAREAGLLCAYVSNGNATPEVLQYLRPYLDAYKVDLKTMQDKQYRQLGGVLQHVLDTIKMAYDLGLWVEVVTLVIPGFNDSPEELWEAARFLVSVSPDIPWHMTAFHPDYKMTDPPPTPAKTLLRAAEIGQEAGLHFVYAGNLPGRVGSLENTYCPQCQALLIERRGYIILDYRLTAAGTCPQCGYKIPGIWPKDPREVRLHGWGYPRPVRRLITP
ncbi:AmmeMemoRadiSam system radical SAM enzyme [Thermanaerothrix sp. 4228-RoL]|uniref:AmmeMemoRadiSam system radical SAM enzyme n=1 Tax=Thermanaerothrix solaris TaxID=3058434 RepID=A0ABU3NPL6_9CHLR|nr:AmmeMemoRadiSam system radical SAM enzyme [Thermanaerothrix sp. 4228-RoL]MDT8898781.1 AmmeMemoRadiSam system radical SAM enzyme [Thermanaerothrix sp. 4228-RoL]